MGEDERRTQTPRVSILLPVRDDGGVDTETVKRIVDALYADPGAREVLAARPDPAGRAYATLSDLKGLPPAEDVPFLIQEIGVLTVPSPAGGARAVGELLREVAPEAQVREVGEYRLPEDVRPKDDN